MTIPSMSETISFATPSVTPTGTVEVQGMLPTISFGAPAETIAVEVPVATSLPPLETVIDIRLGAEDAVQVTDVMHRVKPSESRRDMISGEWGWEELRDYVVRKIEERWGTSPRDPLKEAGIFKGFVGRWGDQAKPIAIAACEVHGCLWRSAPLTITRFTKGNDPYFASVIAANLPAAA